MQIYIGKQLACKVANRYASFALRAIQHLVDQPARFPATYFLEYKPSEYALVYGLKIFADIAF